MRLGWRGIAGIVLSVALLLWVMRDVSPGEIADTLRQSDLGWFLLAAALATLAFPMRAWRWRYILHGAAPDLPFGPLWRATAIGMMANNVLPARAGEVARALALSREERRVRVSAALASLVVDRLFDAIVILLFLVGAIAAPSFPRGTVIGGRPIEQWAMIFAAVGGLALGGLLAIALFPTLVLAVFDATVARLAPRAAERGRRIIEGFVTGLGVLKDPGRFAIVFALTAAQWIVNGASFWVGFRAVEIGAPFGAAIFLQSLLALGVAIPSSPGFFGVFEAFAVAALAVYGVSAPVAVTFALGYHVLSFIPITLIGLWYFARLGLRFRDMSAAPTEA